MSQRGWYKRGDEIIVGLVPNDSKDALNGRKHERLGFNEISNSKNINVFPIAFKNSFDSSLLQVKSFEDLLALPRPLF